MTAPEDYLAQALRQALLAAAEQVEPGTEGLARIRAKTSGRTPQPWLVSVVNDAISRVRCWTWQGHWAWQDPHHGGWAAWLENLRLAAWRRAATAPRTIRLEGLTWTRLAGGLAAAASIATIAVAVPPVRAALVQVSATVMTGGDESLQPGAGASGGAAGTGAGTANSLAGSQAAGSSAGGKPGTGGNPSATLPGGALASPWCGTPTPTTSVPPASGPSAVSLPGTQVPSGVVSVPYASPTGPARTCPAPTPSPRAPSATPTPTASPSSAAPTATPGAGSTSPSTPASPSSPPPSTPSPSDSPSAPAATPSNTGAVTPGDNGTGATGIATSSPAAVNPTSAPTALPVGSPDLAGVALRSGPGAKTRKPAGVARPLEAGLRGPGRRVPELCRHRLTSGRCGSAARLSRRHQPWKYAGRSGPGAPRSRRR